LYWYKNKQNNNVGLTCTRLDIASIGEEVVVGVGETEVVDEEVVAVGVMVVEVVSAVVKETVMVVVG
jgi:hypothetical protein